jgi:hypothetical protein
MFEWIAERPTAATCDICGSRYSWDMSAEAARFPDIERTIENALDGTPDSPLTPQDIQRRRMVR